MLPIIMGFPLHKGCLGFDFSATSNFVASSEDFCNVFRSLFWRLDKDVREQWASITWALWSARNKFVFEGVMMPPSKVVEIGNNLWGEYGQACVRCPILPIHY